MTYRPSNTDITQRTKPVIWAGSEDDVFMTKDSAIRVARANFATAGLQVGGGDPGDDSKENDRPELSDIASITQTIYYDSKQKKKLVKVVIKMRNNSGKNLLGIDARLTKPVAVGGNNG